MSDPLDPHADEWAAMDDLDKIRFMVETDGPVVACADDAGVLRTARVRGDM